MGLLIAVALGPSTDHADPHHRLPLRADHLAHGARRRADGARARVRRPPRGCATRGRRTSCSARSCPTSRGRSSSSSPCGSATRSSPPPGSRFLGFGIQPPSPDWGLQVAEHYGLISGGFWWPVLFPSLAIAIAGHRREPDRRRRGLGLRAMTVSRAARRSSSPTSRSPTACAASGGPSCAASTSPSPRASPTGSSASRAAASRPRRTPCCGYLPRNGRISSGSVTVAGRGPRGPERGRRCASCAPTQGLDGLPEPRRRAEPDDPRRRPGGRGVHDRRRGSEAGDRAGAGDAAQGADLRSRQRDAPLRAPALGRHAAARGHRHGAGQGPDAADPRRADDRASTPRSRPRCSTSSPRCARSSARASCSSATTST